MAKLHEEVLTIKVSRLLRDSDLETEIISNDDLHSLTEVVTELAGGSVLVEVVRK